MRPIDADALMARIDDCVFTADMTTTLAVNMACRWIDNAPTVEPELQWIPCSERLPDAGKTILISDGCEVLIGYYSGGDRWTVDGCEYDPILEEIAWMPLPEPWKGEI